MSVIRKECRSVTFTLGTEDNVWETHTVTLTTLRDENHEIISAEMVDESVDIQGYKRVETGKGAHAFDKHVRYYMNKAIGWAENEEKFSIVAEGPTHTVEMEAWYYDSIVEKEWADYAEK